MRDSGVPIIRLEVEGMRHAILTAFTEQAVKTDAYVRAEVERYCAPANIEQIIRTAAREALDSAIKQEVDSFFRYGEGRKAVAAAVKAKLLEKYSDTALDDGP